MTESELVLAAMRGDMTERFCHRCMSTTTAFNLPKTPNIISTLCTVCSFEKLVPAFPTVTWAFYVDTTTGARYTPKGCEALWREEARQAYLRSR